MPAISLFIELKPCPPSCAAQFEAVRRPRQGEIVAGQPSVTPDQAMALFADGLALVYHEARHVRHLIKAGYVSKGTWEAFLSLPANRVDAWRHLQPLRSGASTAQTAQGARQVFEARFLKSLEDLAALYADTHWKHADSVGGHAWRGVTDTVAQLGMAIDAGEETATTLSASRLLGSRHNNGAVSSKIIGLDRGIERMPGDVWIRASTGA